MKDKIIIFIIGLLVGAILATGAFFIYTKINQNSCTVNEQTKNLPEGNPPEMPNGERPEMNGEEPPEKPSEESSEQKENSSSEKTKKSHSKKTSDTTENN